MAPPGRRGIWNTIAVPVRTAAGPNEAWKPSEKRPGLVALVRLQMPKLLGSQTWIPPPQGKAKLPEFKTGKTRAPQCAVVFRHFEIWKLAFRLGHLEGAQPAPHPDLERFPRTVRRYLGFPGPPFPADLGGSRVRAGVTKNKCFSTSKRPLGPVFIHYGITGPGRTGPGAP